MLIKKYSYKSQVYNNIKEGIITGLYHQGEVLNERNLAKDLGISRTPVREALQLLNKDGWVVIEPYKGALVRTFDEEYIKNILDVRRPLEILAVKKAALNATEEDIKFLENNLLLQEKCFENYSPAKFMNLDREFHRKTYNLTYNELLIDILDNINDIIRFLGIQVLKLPERHKTTLEEHTNVYLAIKNKDVEEARTYMDIHMIETAKHTLSQVTTKGSA